MAEAAVLQRAEQPERDFERGEADWTTGSSPARSRRPRDWKSPGLKESAAADPALRPAMPSSTNTDANAIAMPATGSA